MSGHSKWSTIKRKKGKADAERGRLFTRLIKEITIAARHGGGDENTNPRLRSAVQAARTANMPLANVEKAIKRGTGELPGVVYEEIVYEGYGPGGIAVYVETLTDNKNRTVAEMRHTLTRYGGSLGESGSVAWMFHKKGVIWIDANGVVEDDLMMAALDAGAEDMKREDDYFRIVTEPAKLEIVKNALTNAGFTLDSAEISMEPSSMIKVEGKAAESVIKLMDLLEEHEDVQNVYSNFDIDDKVIESMDS